MLASVREQLINKYRQNENDTGSTVVQIIQLTDRIERLTSHFKKHAKDFGSKRGLLILVGQRRKFLKYLEHHNEAQYKELIASLSLRK